MKLIETMEKEVYSIKKECMHLSWYMRGGATYNDVLNMSVEERKIIGEIIDSNMETTKKTQLPFI